MTRNMIIVIWIWLTAFLHPVIFPCVKHTVKEIENGGIRRETQKNAVLILHRHRQLYLISEKRRNR